MKKLFIRIIVVIITILFCMVYTSLKNYNKIKRTDIYFLNYVYESYVSTYYDFPISEEHFKQYFIRVSFIMDRTTEFISNNPLIENNIQFTHYIDSIPRIRVTLSKIPRSEDDLIKNSIPIENYTFFHYLTNSKTILLFDHVAWKCGGRRLTKVFNCSEPDRCFNEQEIQITRILKGFYKGKGELFDLTYGSQSSCYHIRASKIDSTFLFSAECLPQDSTWIDQKELDKLLDSLESSFDIPELRNVDHFFFPLIVRNTTIQHDSDTINLKSK